ncbi:heterocyst frequency control protein PatD [Phormidium sp. CLA17]|uniref:heterocyst frequency control protein PatD n=1 Tax=Leptolyngbya sp. Cla-17 TaxID=2803751 RepID=UPI001490DD7C|nr:heterocyst frequency control protein PatD [Leptolyngbya sp. Cla-17]MBM0742036.1 heterocyst frequency control protein PatD [Leptolyngbya sp. Cla-17]
MTQFENCEQIPKLPPEYSQTYQKLKQHVTEINQAIAQRTDVASLKASVADLQVFFKTHIRMLNSDELDAALAHQVQSFNVEIDKQLRLLSMDVMFLQAAKQASTADQRLNQMRDRLTLLLRYCDGLLEER